MVLAQAQIEEAAAFLFHLRVQRQSVSALPPEIVPRSLDDAYAIQDAIHDTAGWPIGVLKVGCTSDAAREALGIPHPIAGRVPADAIFASGSTIPNGFFSAPPAIECEVAVQLDGDGGIVAAAPALELVDPRVRSSGSFGGITTVADNAAACAVVLGSPVPVAELASGDIDRLDVALTADGATIATGTSADVLGGPQASVDWLLEHERNRGRSVADGMWVITGTCTGLTPSVFDTTYEASFASLGTVEYRTGP